MHKAKQKGDACGSLDLNNVLNQQSWMELCYFDIVAKLPLEINSWLMPNKYDMEQLMPKWIGTVTKGYE